MATGDQINPNPPATGEELKFGSSATDEQLVNTIDTWINESNSYHNILLQAASEGVSYYMGNQTDMSIIPRFNSNTVRNRIFEGTETLVPIITGSAHQFVAMPGNEDENSLKRSQKVQQILTRKYDDLNIQGLLEEAVRDIILKRYGVLEWFWDHTIDDVGVRVVDPKLILMPPLRLLPKDLPYILRIHEFTKSEIEEEFPDFKEVDELTPGKTVATEFVGRTGRGGIGHLGSLSSVGGIADLPEIFQVIEARTDEFWVWKNGTVILRKEANPYWDFEGERQGEDTRKKPKEGEEASKDERELKFFNHLEKPSKALVFMTPFRTGEVPVAVTSLAEIAIPIQDDINTQKRQIVNALVRMGNPRILVDKGAIEDEMLMQITNEAGLQIVGDGIASENRVRFEPGTPLPASHFSNLQDSLSAFDDVFGIQPALRGASASKTLGGQQLNRQQNLSRVDLITRSVNRGMGELADGIIQLQRMFYTEKKIVRLLGVDDAVEFIEFSRDDIDDNIVVDVKSGPTPPQGPVARQQNAIQMWQLGAIDPVSFYQDMGVPNPEERAKKLQAWKTNQLLLKTEADIAVANAGATARGGGTESSKGVETPANAQQRSEKAVNETAPAALPRTPK